MPLILKRGRQGERTDLPPLPFCACNCGERVRRRHRRYVAGHVPGAIRAEGGRKGGRSRIFRHRRQKFERHFADLTRDGRAITKETLLTVLAEVFREAYTLGYHACDYKHGRSHGRARKAA